MNYYTKLLLALSLFILSACGNNMLKYSAEEFNKNENAVVFFDVKEEEYNSKKYSLPFVITKYGSKETFKVYHRNGTLFYKSESKNLVKRMIFLEPGIYYISYITLLDQGDLKRWYPGPGLSNKIISYGAFQVQAGEVVSLGVLHTNGKNFSHERNFSTLKQQLIESDKSELAPKLKEGAFYIGGSMLIDDKNHFPRLISAQVIEKERNKLLDEIARRVQNNLD